MININARNVNEAFQIALLHVQEAMRQGTLREVNPRGQRRLEFKTPFCTTYTHPRERVLFDATRDANPFFHFMESLWILAGSKDVTWLSQWLPNIKDYSDNGTDFHGAYGERLHAYGQLNDVIRRLRDEPDGNRAVLAIYMPQRDSKYTGLDMPCFAGDTVLWSPEGDLSISEVAKKFKDGSVTKWPVYSVNPLTKEMKLAWASRVWRSGVKQTIKLCFSDGSHLKVTPDHLLYLRKNKAIDACAVKAGTLKPGDRILATQRFYDPKGHEQFKSKLGDNTSFSNMVKTHRAYAELLWGKLKPKYVVHHRDEVKVNNRSTNLEVMTEGRHNSIHRIKDNPMKKLSPEKHRARAEKQSQSLRATNLKKRGGPPLHPPRRIGQRKWPMLQTDNHVIVSVEVCGAEPVYDFTVPGYHTALVGTGIVAHNCNTTVFLSLREGRLDLTVCNRSNDLIWGTYGANVVQFSVLQEYIAACIGVEVGTYVQFSNNTHIYPDNPATQRCLKVTPQLIGIDPYTEDPYLNTMPLMSNGPLTWSYDLHDFMDDENAKTHVIEPLFRHVATPMRHAYQAYRANLFDEAFELAATIQAEDWSFACSQWLGRRKEARKAKVPA
jgi:thymidylate synthase